MYIFFMHQLTSLVAALSRIRGLRLSLLAAIYVLAYMVVELMIVDPIRHYNFCVFLSLSGIYFSWLIGGKRTMMYVAFFNIFFVMVFSKILWDQGIIVYGSRLFFGRSFVAMYAIAVGLGFLMFFKTSPADALQEKQRRTIDEARQQKQNLEFMVASRKLKSDLLAQANLVKDELQLLEGTWKSKIHDIVNDLPPVKERELYKQVIRPFEENIIHHLRDLEDGLTFDLESIELADLCRFIAEKAARLYRSECARTAVSIEKAPAKAAGRGVLVDRNKVWDIVLNIFRNSQAALDFKRLDRLKAGGAQSFVPRIEIGFSVQGTCALITVTDNAGGVSSEVAHKLYQEPVLSRKRGNKKYGQGSLFVKFFAERMGITVEAHNTELAGEKGLRVDICLPLAGNTPETAYQEA